MGWNYRILAHKYEDDIYLQIHEVYYNSKNKPIKYTENPVTIGGESLDSINLTLSKMIESKNKPILWSGKKFPLEMK